MDPQSGNSEIQQPVVNQPSAQQVESVVSSQKSNVFGNVLLILGGLIVVLGIIVITYYLGTNGIKRKQLATTRTNTTTISPAVTVTTSPQTKAVMQIDKNFWRTDTSSFSAEELQSLQTILLKSGEPSDGKLVVTGAQRGGYWAMLAVTTVLSSTNQLRQTTPGTVLAHKNTNGEWSITSQGDKEYCAQLKLASGPLSIDQVDYHYFCD